MIDPSASPRPPPSPARRAAASLCIAALVLTAPQLLLAQLSKEDRARAEAKAMEAKIEYKAGNHEKAARFFLEAFAISRAPALMYNAARAYQKGGMPSKAIVVFEQYLELDGVSDDGRNEAKGHLRRLRAEIASRRAKTPPPKPPPATRPRGQAPADPPAKGAAGTKGNGPKAPPGSARTPGDRTPGTPPGVDLSGRAGPQTDWLTWGLIGGGGLSLLIGLVTMASASSAMGEANDMDFSVDDAKVVYNDKADAAESTHGAGIFFTLLGLGAGAWGGYRYLAARPSPPGPATSWFGAPLIAPARGGQVVFGWTLGGHFR